MADDKETPATTVDDLLKGLAPSPKKGDIVTNGSLRRAFRRLAGSLDYTEDRLDPERTQAELRRAWEDVRRASGRYVRLYTPDITIDGTFSGGGRLFYFQEGEVQSRDYSPEDIVFKGTMRNGKREIYLFDERYFDQNTGCSSYRGLYQGLDALVARFRLLRAGVRGPTTVSPIERVYSYRSVSSGRNSVV